MSKRITHELTYDAPLADVAAMLADPAFREQVCDDQHVLRHEVSVSGSAEDGDLEVTIDQVQAADGIPSFAKKFVGDEINIVQVETWTSPEAGDISVTIPGKPGQMSGTAVLAESGGTTTETVTLDIKVNIPLVGGKIEGLVADLLLKALKSENRTGRAYLSS
ncbi:DUF2505 domain-containing protein [Nocardioides sp. KIGAM211]|uniref:DUF2505 domain-containing protein n=1 Tax=Nocardioides luti TaxID=2761101 RepID=A0A7X0RH13_9ACTN|nr:DUF2505 domain-containing protein [Nocardioides luti]MBB6626873.1 DUF2505 domain-containing protein [Nocardioides luti]